MYLAILKWFARSRTSDTQRSYTSAISSLCCIVDVTTTMYLGGTNTKYHELIVKELLIDKLIKTTKVQTTSLN
jgi:hypothetical protein